ncbi:MAG TPA: (2Fe-2S)-binding protein [Bacillota bacterium]
MEGQPVDRPLLICPASGTKGKTVSLETLRSLIKPSQQDRITAGPYRYCDAPGCEVVYFAEDGSHVFTRDDLRVRVGAKEAVPPRPICYCFNHTYEEIIEEIRRTGVSSVPDDIRSKLKTKGCDCVHTNPQGSCCLGVVLSVVGEASKRVQKGTTGAPTPAHEDCCKPGDVDDDGGDAGGCCPG